MLLGNVARKLSKMLLKITKIYQKIISETFEDKLIFFSCPSTDLCVEIEVSGTDNTICSLPLNVEETAGKFLCLKVLMVQ